MTDDSTLGGYFQTHQRPPAFEGTDRQPYSVAMYVDDTPAADGRLGGALLFVRWSSAGDQPEGHLETGYLVHGTTPGEVEEQLRALTLHEIKDHLDQVILKARELPHW